MATNQVTLGGVQYDVIEQRTQESMLATHPNVAREMAKAGIVAQMTLRRPRGNRLWCAYEYANGTVSRIVSVA